MNRCDVCAGMAVTASTQRRDVHGPVALRRTYPVVPIGRMSRPNIALIACLQEYDLLYQRSEEANTVTGGQASGQYRCVGSNMDWTDDYCWTDKLDVDV
eukprot:780259-Amphidinium_carterae.1